MKKLMMLIIILGTTTTLFAWTASSGIITLGSTVKEEVTLSNGVYAGYNGTASAYGIGTVHQSGTKSYGASSASSSIHYQVISPGTTTPKEVSAGESTWTSPWTLEGK